MAGAAVDAEATHIREIENYNRALNLARDAALRPDVFVGIFSLMTSLWLAVGVLALAGVFHSVYSALNASLMQLKAATEYRSRVVSLQTMTWGLTPFAGLLMGQMIDRWGASHVIFGWMVVAAAVTLAMTFGSRELRRV